MPSRSGDVTMIERWFSDGDVMVGSLMDLLDALINSSENYGMQKGKKNMNVPKQVKSCRLKLLR